MCYLPPSLLPAISHAGDFLSLLCFSYQGNSQGISYVHLCRLPSAAVFGFFLILFPHLYITPFCR